MRWLLRKLAAIGAAALLAALIVVAQPVPSEARANVGCEVASAPAGAISGGVGAITGGAIGGGNPVGDACNAVTDGAVGAVTSPVTNALKGIGNGILGQVTSWVAEGATWLIGQVVAEIEKTTTPELTTQGFLGEYARMSEIAALLAVAMLLLAILEAVAQSSWAVLIKAFFVSVPLAFLGTSVAFTIVQLLLVATDGMSHAIAAATQNHSEHFFKAAIGDLSHAGATGAGKAAGAVPAVKPEAEAQGATVAPLFVTFLAAIIGAFAAFCVWIELLMRDAAVYVVALFMPMALAASIWPRWSGALRRTGELLVVVIGSKFVIVSIIALAAGLVSEEGAAVEHILAASALMLLACFAPLVLFKLVPFAEGAIGGAYSRRSAAGGAIGGMQLANSAQMIGHTARSNWSGAKPEVWSVKADGEGGSPGSGGSGGGGRPSGPPRPGNGPQLGRAAAASAGGGKAAEAAGGGAAAAVPASALAAAPVAAARGAKANAQRLEQSGTARAAGGSPPPQETLPARHGSDQPGEEPARPEQKPPSASPRPPAEAPPRPPQDLGAKPSPKARDE
jgi:hypothetical protein